jgi:hypothetical protein
VHLQRPPGSGMAVVALLARDAQVSRYILETQGHLSAGWAWFYFSAVAAPIMNKRLVEAYRDIQRSLISSLTTISHIILMEVQYAGRSGVPTACEVVKRSSADRYRTLQTAAKRSSNGIIISVTTAATPADVAVRGKEAHQDCGKSDARGARIFNSV